MKCSRCNAKLSVGDEAHVVDEHVYCSKECAVMTLTDDIILNAKECAAEQYACDAVILTVRLTGNHAQCSICNKDLATCESIWAAEGSMYCSRECGLQVYKDDSMLDMFAEELSPDEIGLEVYYDE